MTKELDEKSYKKRIENIEKGKSYLNKNCFFVRNQTIVKIYKDLFIKSKRYATLITS